MSSMQDIMLSPAQMRAGRPRVSPAPWTQRAPTPAPTATNGQPTRPDIVPAGGGGGIADWWSETAWPWIEKRFGSAPAAGPIQQLGLPSLLPGLIGAGAGFGIQQLMRGGNGGAVIDGIPLGGPGLAEPPAEMVAKEWSTGTAQFYQMLDGRIAVYSKKKRRWKVYRPSKHIVVPRNPRIGTLLRADKRTDRLMARIGKRTRRVTRKVSTVKG